MFQAVCLLVCPGTFALIANSEDVSSEVVVSAPPRGNRQGCFLSSVRAKILGMSQATCLFG
eukprot:9077436-Pyramimonas_sp.AAC.1